MAVIFFSWRQAILDSDLQPTTRHVLLTLACHMNDAGESCYPSIELLCKETGLSNRAVITHLQKAAESGWVKVGKHGFAGQRWANNEYRMSWPTDICLEKDAEKVVNDVHNVEEKVVNKVHDLPKKAVNLVPKGSEPDDRKVVNDVHTSTSINSSKSTSLNTITAPKKSSPDLLSKIDPQIAADFMAIRKAKNLPLTKTALGGIEREAERIGYTLEQALRTCCERGWAGFKADWILREESQKGMVVNGRLPNKQEALEESNRAATAGWMPPELRERHHAN